MVQLTAFDDLERSNSISYVKVLITKNLSKVSAVLSHVILSDVVSKVSQVLVNLPASSP